MFRKRSVIWDTACADGNSVAPVVSGPSQKQAGGIVFKGTDKIGTLSRCLT